MKYNRIHQRALSILLSLALVFGIFAIDTVGASAASGDGRTTLTLDSNITITDSGSYVITQQNNEQSVTNTITVDSGMAPDIELENVNINVSNSDTNQCAFSIAAGASVRLTLTGTNTLVSGGSCAGLRVPASTDGVTPDASLTITDQSTGSLNVTGTGYEIDNVLYGGAGIGGSNNESGGKITINGGIVIAQSAMWGAGIGGGCNGNGGSIAISGGTVMANGSGGAGIGGGSHGNGGSIAISGGTVTANGGPNGAGIGGGDYGKGTADGGTISISGGTVTAKGGDFGAGIGGGEGGTGTGDEGTISVSGGVITANGGRMGAGIGGGIGGNGTGESGTISVSGGIVIATGGLSFNGSPNGGAGIGGGYDGTGGTIQINGMDTEVTAQGKYGGHDIGSGASGSGGGSLTVWEGATLAMLSVGTDADNPSYTGGCRIITVSESGQTETVYGGSNPGSRTVLTAVLKAQPTAVGKLQLTASVLPAEAGNFTFSYCGVKDSGTIADNVAIQSDGTATVTCNNPPAHGLTVLTAKYRGDSNPTYDALKAKFFYDPDAIDLSTVNTGGYGYTYDTYEDADPGAITLTQNGWYVFTGNTTTNKIKVPNGISACVTLDNSLINVSGHTDKCAFSLDPGAAVNLILKNDNTLTSGGSCAGLRVPASTTSGISDASLTITAQSTDDSLTAAGSGYMDETMQNFFGGAGIGGNNGETGGSIAIDGGTIEATCAGSNHSGTGGAGIGGGSGGAGGNVTINGGTVMVYEDSNDYFGCGAGIGGGWHGAGGNINIADGTVTAYGGADGAGIGGGGAGIGGNVSITGGTIDAEGGNGAGIGGGDNGGAGGIIHIGGGIVEASSGNGAGIGGGQGGKGGTVSITGADAQVAAWNWNGYDDIGSGDGSTDGGTLMVAGTDLGHGPQVELQNGGINAVSPTETPHQFTNCKIYGDGAKSTSNPDISGCYDASGKIRLSAALSAVPTSGSTVFGSPVTLTAHITRFGFGDTPTLSGTFAFFCDSSTAIGSPVLLSDGVASVSWTPADAAEHQLTVQYQNVGSEAYAINPEDIASYPFTYSAGKASLTVTTPPTASQIPSGSKLSASTFTGGTVTDANGTTISGTFAWAQRDQVVTASGKYDAIFTANDPTDYNTVLVSVPVTVTAAPTPTPASNDGNSSGTSTVALPSGVTDATSNTQADLSGVTVPAGVTTVTLSAIQEAANGTPTTLGTTGSLVADPQGAEAYTLAVSTPSLNIIGMPSLYNIKLLDQNGNPITGFSGAVTVKIPLPKGLHGTPHIFWYDESTGKFTDMNATVQNGFIVFSTTHFSYYMVAGTGNSITLDTKSYQMPIKGQYQIGLKLTGSKAAAVKFHSTSDKTAAVTKLKNGNYQVIGKGVGTAWIMFDVYDKNHLLTHASVKIDVKTGIRPRGDSTRQIGVF